MSYEIPNEAFPEDRRLRYPLEVRVELVRLYRAGFNSRQAAAALGLPKTYTANRMHLWRKRRVETVPNPEVIELVKGLAFKGASDV